MFKYLKVEYLKMVHSKHLLWINVLLLLYTALILLLYYSDGLHAYDILPNYNDEYFVLFLILSVFWGLSSVGDEMNYRTDLWYSKNKFILFKVFFLALYILFIYMVSPNPKSEWKLYVHKDLILFCFLLYLQQLKLPWTE